MYYPFYLPFTFHDYDFLVENNIIPVVVRRRKVNLNDPTATCFASRGN